MTKEEAKKLKSVIVRLPHTQGEIFDNNQGCTIIRTYVEEDVVMNLIDLITEE